MQKLKAEWSPFPDTAPKDHNILVRGTWKASEDDLMPDPGGQPVTVIGRWGSIKANGTDKQWFMQFLTPFTTIHAEFTEWTELPE
jgi:hypothetical protein